MAELADALDLGSSGEIRGGSSPLVPSLRIEYEGDGVQAIAKASWRRTILKQMAEMGVASGTQDLDPAHSV